MRWRTGSALALALCCAGGPGLYAQEPAPPPGVAPGGGAERAQDWREMRRQEMRNKIEVIRIARLTDVLKLDPETAARLVPILARFDAVDKQHRKTSAELGRELARLTESDTADEAALRAGMERWWDNEEQHIAKRRALFNELEGVLTTEQQARLMVFIPRFQRQIRQIARELGGGGRGGRQGGPFGKPGGGPPPDWFGNAVEGR